MLRAVLSGLVLISVVLTSVAFAEMPPLPRGKGEFCVEPTDVMRRDHMKFLLHQRDQTVYDGIRTRQHSLNECVACHVQNNAASEFIPVDAPGQFCEVCHTYSSVKLDCFECHATKPHVDSDSASLTKPRSGLTAQAFRVSPHSLRHD